MVISVVACLTVMFPSGRKHHHAVRQKGQGQAQDRESDFTAEDSHLP
ncbi:hypothetical protein [Dickeya zeae]|nr:hypothetical protein [Dickeya zeae]MCA6987893.1 hypothetical protein [Dickeya zeae]